MNFRRIPFQFKTTDPAERQSELMKRFGLPTDEKMHIETANTPIFDAVSNSASGSPRLQHRLPYFENDVGQTVKETHEQENRARNIDSGKQQPRVRVIPIQVESSSSNGTVSRQEQCSGSSVYNSGSSHSLNQTEHGKSHFSSQMHEPYISKDLKNSVSNPKIFNIPIGVKGNLLNQNKSASQGNIPLQKKPVVSSKNPVQNTNGSCVSKSSNGPCLSKPTISQPKESTPKLAAHKVNILLKQISIVLKEFQSYKSGVEQFSGKIGDKQYRYLDEMLTRCMINLDDVETFGNEEVRKARKTAVKEVQDCINILEAKVQNTNLNENLAENSDHIVCKNANTVEGAKADTEEDTTMDVTEMKEETPANVEIEEILNKEDLSSKETSGDTKVKKTEGVESSEISKMEIVENVADIESKEESSEDVKIKAESAVNIEIKSDSVADIKDGSVEFEVINSGTFGRMENIDEKFCGASEQGSRQEHPHPETHQKVAETCLQGAMELEPIPVESTKDNNEASHMTDLTSVIKIDRTSNDLEINNAKQN